MSVFQHGAQRASSHRSLRLTAFALVTALVVSLGAVANPAPVSAAAVQVVIVVGPAGSSTGKYIDSAKSYASQARSYGANVVEVYSPNATWSRVRAAAQGANLLIYLGHGNGYPSPYGPFSKYRRDGMGLNSTAGNGHYNVKYVGEYQIGEEIQLAGNAIVLLNRLCYAAGNSEWGTADPTRATAIKRVDNYGAGFIGAGAKAVFAEAISSLSYTIRALLKSERTVDSIFMSHPSASGARDFTFDSVRTPGAVAHMDPPRLGKYWRSVIGDLRLTAAAFRAGG